MRQVDTPLARKAHPHIMGYVIAAGAFGAMPVVDIALVPALQMQMFMALGLLYKLKWTRRHTSEFLGLFGSGFLAGYGLRLAGREVIKLIPGWGQTVGAVWGATTSAAITYALGKAACYYLERTGQGLSVDPEILRNIYAQAFTKGKTLAVRNQEQGAQ